MIEKTISNIVSSQFPSFYREEGPQFINFIKSYYEWMETEGKSLYEARRIPEYLDIDSTVDEFLIHFKQKYLNNIQFDVKTNKRLLLKHSLDIHRSKGSPRSFDLFFKLVYGENAKIYYPGDDIFRLDNNQWILPNIIEVNYGSDTKPLIGKTIRGHISNATAFCESAIKLNGSYYLKISNIEGDFRLDEALSVNSEVAAISPRIKGSVAFVEPTFISSMVSGEEYVVETDSRNLIFLQRKDGSSIVDSGLSVSTNPSLFYAADEQNKSKKISWNNKQGGRINRRSLIKTAVDGWTNYGPHSSEGYSSKCFAYCSGNIETIAALGMSSVPSTDLSYENIDFAILFDTGIIRVYESNTLIGSYGAFLETDLFEIEYSGTSIKYKKNGIVFRTSTTTANRTFHLDVSVFSSGGRLDNIYFQPESFSKYGMTTSFRSAVGHFRPYYGNREGFLDDSKFFHDNEYYQEYSYQINSPMTFDRYSDVLKKSLHVAGTKMFGAIETQSETINSPSFQTIITEIT